MGLKDLVDRATHVDYACRTCGAAIREGDRFGIVGTMSAAIRRADIARTDIQVRTLGGMLCEPCLQKAVTSPS